MKKYILTGFLLMSLSFSFSQQVEGITGETFFDRMKEIKKEKSDETLYVFNFWATWCVPCVKELPAFQKLSAEYRDQNVKLIFVSLDFDSDLNKKVIPFVKDRKIEEEVWVLTNYLRNMTWIEQVSKAWSGSIPATLIYQPERDIYDFKESSFEFEELEAWVSEYL